MRRWCSGRGCWSRSPNSSPAAPAADGRELGAAAAPDRDLAVLRVPGAVFDTRGVGELAHQARAALPRRRARASALVGALAANGVADPRGRHGFLDKFGATAAPDRDLAE